MVGEAESVGKIDLALNESNCHLLIYTLAIEWTEWVSFHFDGYFVELKVGDAKQNAHNVGNQFDASSNATI